MTVKVPEIQILPRCVNPAQSRVLCYPKLLSCFDCTLGIKDKESLVRVFSDTSFFYEVPFPFRGSQSEVILAYSDSVHSFHRTFGIVTGLGILLRGDQTFPLTPLCQTQKLCVFTSVAASCYHRCHIRLLFLGLSQSPLFGG